MRPATLAGFVAVVLCFAAANAEAQYVYVTGYAPAPVAVYSAPTVAYRPVTPYVSYSPVVAVPAPVVVAPTVVGGPVVTTRYRPILGGTVTRVRYPYTTTTYLVPAY